MRGFSKLLLSGYERVIKKRRGPSLSKAHLKERGKLQIRPYRL